MCDPCLVIMRGPICESVVQQYKYLSVRALRNNTDTCVRAYAAMQIPLYESVAQQYEDLCASLWEWGVFLIYS